MDFDRVKFVINRIEYEGPDNDLKWYVMEPLPDIHIHCHYCQPVLVDADGKEYPVEILTDRILSKESEPRIYEYWFGFEENDPDFPVGKVFTKKRDCWKKDIPDSPLISIDYIVDGFDVGTFTEYEIGQITVQSGGEILLVNKENKWHAGQETISVYDREMAKKVLVDMLACVSRSDSYGGISYNDTGYKILFYFENGESLSYSGYFCYDDETGEHSTCSIMYGLKKYVESVGKNI